MLGEESYPTVLPIEPISDDSKNYFPPAFIRRYLNTIFETLHFYRHHILLQIHPEPTH